MLQTHHKLRSLYVRSLFFNYETRSYFYTTLQEYVRSRFPLMNLFNDLQEQKNSLAVKEIARISKQALRQNQPFASYYQESGLFTEREARLLILGERYDCIENITALLLEQNREGSPVTQIIAPSGQWIAMFLILTVMSIYAEPYLNRLTEGYRLFFDYALFVKEYWLHLSASAAAVSVGYCVARDRATGLLRTTLMRLGAFRIHAITTEQQFIRLGERLIETKLPANEFLSLMEQIFRRNRPFLLTLQQARARLKETSLVEVLENILSNPAYRHIQATAPNQTNEEIARGMGAAYRIQRIKLNRLIGIYRVIWLFVFLSATLALTIPFALVSMGMGIQQ